MSKPNYNIPDLAKAIRPANMRTAHGLRSLGQFSLSVSAAHVTEDTLADPHGVAASGSGLDAPEDLPTGSVKAFFTDHGTGQFRHVFGFCQRTTRR